jgi:HSP20 family protein
MHRSQRFPGYQFLDEMERLRGNLFSEWPGLFDVGGRRFPAVNVWESGETLHVEAELPGLAADQLEISVVGRELTLKGARPEQPHGEAPYHRRERGVGSFHRTVRLPYEVDSAQVTASYRDGVLLIALPKAEAARPRKVNVTAS